MKKPLCLFVTMLLPLSVFAQGYTSLWKKVTDAEAKDLPKTQMEWLGQIIDKAEKEKQYGHLLKAQLRHASVQSWISPDSLATDIQRLEQKADNAEGDVLRAVYAAVLGKVYQGRPGQEAETKSRAWFAKSMENPALLAAQKSATYEPALVNGIDSKIFHGDLLHAIGIEAGDYAALHRYYSSNGNRAAACISAYYLLRKDRESNIRLARKSKYLQRVDSLISVYEDLREAGELAIEHYDYISQCSDVTVEDRINYINYALSRWGAWPRMHILRNAQSDLQTPLFNINIGDYMLLPHARRKLYINSIRNIGELRINLYRVNMDGNTDLDPNDESDYKKLQKLIQPGTVQTIVRRYIGQPAWKENHDSVVVDKLPVGVYLIEAVTDNKVIVPQRALLRVSDLYVMHEMQPDKRIRFVVVNATTGKPVPGAHIVLTTDRSYNEEEDTQVTITSNKNGEASYRYENPSPDRVYVYTDEDRACGNFRLDSYYSYWERPSINSTLSLYTDRSVYRPGQQVHVAALAYRTDRESVTANAIADREIDFTMRDANGKEVTKKKAKTDAFGMASVSFVLPQSGLTGTFTIQAGGGDISSGTHFRVEQYKRPTFRVEFDDYKQAYQPGDTVEMRAVARSYAGVPVQGAKVQYTVKRRRNLWWRWNNPDDTGTLHTDSATTADDGSFVVRMPMMFPDNVTMDRPLYYKVEVNAQVTDVAGETHEASASLPLSNRSSVLTSNMPEKSLRDSLKVFTFVRRNIAGQDIAGTVRYRFDDGAWKTAEANSPVTIEKKLASGRHRLIGICENDTVEQTFVVFAYTDKRPPVETSDWFYVSDSRFRTDGRPVYMQVGSTDEDVHVYYSVFKDKQVLEQGSKVLSNEVHTQKLVYKESYGDGIVINLAWVKRGRLYTHRVSLKRPEPANRQMLSWKTFRDQLTPGQKEEWTLRILGPDGKPSRSQLMAVMYDKSLDGISKHNWAFSPTYNFTLPTVSWNGGSGATIGLYGFQGFRSLEERTLDFTRFDGSMFDFALPHNSLAHIRIRGSHPIKLMATRAGTSKAMHDMAENAEETLSGRLAGMEVSNKQQENPNAPRLFADESGDSPKASDGQQETSIQMRENLNETAFFYPGLVADGQGNVAIRFTLPESVTTWRFMGISHDQQMNFGTITAEAIAKKVVMVQPNFPRFIRVGDKAQISSRIINTSSKDVRGTVRFLLLNPATEAVVCEWSKPFAIGNGKTASIGFDVDGSQLATLSKGGTLFIARILAEGNGFSDGEQHYLPLLPNHERVTTSVPFTQHGAGTKTIDLGQLFPTADAQNRLTVEYTNNPAWLMIQALPSIANPNDKNALSLATAIYANSIGYGIIKSSPKIGQTLKLWQQETGKETSMMSNLQKNEDLKTMVLSETPWVADAEKETDQKQQLLNFLDETTIGYRNREFTDKLKALQGADGAFSWWPGMPGNTYMTVGVVNILTRLNRVMGTVNANADMLGKAFAYLDRRMAEEVSELKKLEKKGQKQLTPSETACNYLYANALAGRPQTKDAAYLVALLEKMPTSLTIYGKANSAVILAYYDKKQRAKEYLQSLNEYSVYKEEMGRYYDTHRAHYTWFDYKIPTQVAAIEAMQMLTPADIGTIEEMQRWLLQEKRTTNWTTPLNAVNAIYAFLTNEQSKLDMTSLAVGNQTALKIDGKAMTLPQATAGLGYVKTTTYPANASVFTAEKTSGGTSWGALYAQYWQEASDVESASEGLSVRREILTPSGERNAERLKVGDKVKVRIVITADRDYDFVQVQDKHAACLEPASQLSGYRWGYYCTPQDNATNYYFDRLPKGTHVVETEYYVDREGDYTTGICTAQCAYSPEFSAREHAVTLHVTK